MTKKRELVQSLKPLWYLFYYKHHSRLNGKFPDHWIRTIQWSTILLSLISGSLLLILGFWGHEQSIAKLNFDRIWAEYIKTAFLIQTFIVIIWFIASIKERPVRLEEFRLLVSLPIKPQTIFAKFFLSDLFYFSWVPIVLVISYLGLLPFSSFSFLSRPILLSVVAYVFAIAVMAVVHLLISFKVNKLKLYNYLTKLNPLVQCFVLIGFASALLTFMFIPMSMSKLSFMFIFLIQCFCVMLLIILAKKLFLKLHSQNFWSSVSTPRNKSNKIANSLIIKLIEKLPARPLTNPLLVKNMIQSSRSNSHFSYIIPAAIFIAIAYLMAMNNQVLEDSIAVLLGLTIMYILLSGINSMNRMSPDLESTKLIFTLPISKMQFYFSVFWPALIWTMFIYTAMSFLLIIAGGNFSQVSLFWNKSLFASVLLLSLALNCGLKNYPDIKMAQKSFSFWIAGLIFACALFFKYSYLIAITITLVSYLSLRKVRFYGIHTQLTNQSFL